MAAPPTNKGKQRDPETLTPTELDALLAAASRRSTSGIRARALIGVLYGAGLRVAEAVALYPKDVDTDNRSVRVRRGKGGKARHVAIRPHCCDLIDRWSDRRAQVGLAGRHPLFATYTKGAFGQPMSTRQVRATLARLGDRAGIVKDGPVHPHMLRHTLADQMRRHGRDVEQIKKQLGHANLLVTGRYLNHLSPLDLAEALDW